MGIASCVKESELKVDELKALWILGENNKKKLQFEASPRVVHKRNTSQNIPIWGHKRSNYGYFKLYEIGGEDMMYEKSI